MDQPICDLSKGHCVPCEGGVPAISPEQAANTIEQQLHQDWQLIDEGKALWREFKFKGFGKTMFFVNAMAQIADREMHHPDFEVGFNYCNVKFTTHAIDGLSENDFICAAKVDRLLD